MTCGTSGSESPLQQAPITKGSKPGKGENSCDKPCILLLEPFHDCKSMYEKYSFNNANSINITSNFMFSMQVHEKCYRTYNTVQYSTVHILWLVILFASIVTLKLERQCLKIEQF